MSDSDRPKPLPARPPSHPSASEAQTAAGETESATSPPPVALPVAPPEQVDVAWQGGTWIARVLGRSGRAEARSAHSMLVGFWESGSAAAAPALEATVPGRRLADVPEDALRAALARAKVPPMAGQRRPFFDDGDPTRRSGPASEY